ncbi:MAG TPA: cytochrome c oxidase subunit II, partial [Actinomycetota bacterium]|nr:cytochrome c oxidase subunit II [Actinomycetota bacterium]
MLTAFVRRTCGTGAALVFLIFAACSGGAPSVIDPRSPAAERIASLWWLMLVISAAVFVLVVVMIVVGVVRRGRPGVDSEARWTGPFIVLGGIVASSMILIAVFVVSLIDLRAIAGDTDGEHFTIDVIGHDWWWEARYPGGAVTANEIHVPAGRSVRLRLSTADVIHSFWVPQLGPKTDMIPGRINTAIVHANDPGRYRGQCAEYCGLQHAKMVLWIVADEPAAFEDWLRNESRSRREPTDALARRGERIFLESTCAECHAIRGTAAEGNLGPDLTHLA